MLYANPQIFPHLKAIFVHVPKTGGTSIEQTLRMPNQKAGGHSTALGYQHKFPEQFASYFKFAFVRDPVDRFLSAYRYLNQWHTQLEPYNRAAQDAKTPDEFCAILTATPAIAEKMVHIWPMHKFVCDQAGKIIVDQVYRFETLAADWQALSAKLGIRNIPLRHSNRSQRPPLTADTTPAVLEYVHRVYAQDFTLFGYK